MGLTAFAAAVSLGEGSTPLVAAGRLSAETGFDLHLKCEGANPTGSFKDRGMVVAVGRAAESGASAVVCASTGNTAASAAAFALSLTSSFAALAVLSNVAVLLMYLLCCAACWLLIGRDVRADGPPFNFPGVKIVPALAIIVILWILAHATLREFAVTGAVLAVASILYLLRAKLRRGANSAATMKM